MRLSQEQVREMIVAAAQGVPRTKIAQQYSVDNSTVRYHIERFESKYGSTTAIYSLIPPKSKACTHPSLKCLLCGKAQDAIRRRELETIKELTIKLEQAQAILARYGYELE